MPGPFSSVSARHSGGGRNTGGRAGVPSARPPGGPYGSGVRALAGRRRGPLFTAAYAHRYAPESATASPNPASTKPSPLDFRGAAAAAPPGHWAQILDLAGAGDPQATANPYIALLVSGMAAAEPDVKPADYLTPRGMKVLDVARHGGCLAEVFKAGEGLKNADFAYGTPRNGTPRNGTPHNGAPGLAALLRSATPSRPSPTTASRR
ncbi:MULTISPECIES: hypothetical protein [unclassified Streptomyces]|uniref:hypothetical protein n=1 Tax=unclassified Streptomyces TaxID=2593676 RepID=UPI003243BF67